MEEDIIYGEAEGEAPYDPIADKNQLIQGIINGLDINPLLISIRYDNKTIGITPTIIDMGVIIAYIKEKLAEQII
jgi:hypothetical protein